MAFSIMLLTSSVFSKIHDMKDIWWNVSIMSGTYAAKVPWAPCKTQMAPHFNQPAKCSNPCHKLLPFTFDGHDGHRFPSICPYQSSTMLTRSAPNFSMSRALPVHRSHGTHATTADSTIKIQWQPAFEKHTTASVWIWFGMQLLL